MHANPQRLPAEEPGSSLRLIAKTPPIYSGTVDFDFSIFCGRPSGARFDHDAFAIAKASAYSSILTFFPTLLVVGSVLGNGSRTMRLYSREITYALQRILPAGFSTVQAYLRANNGRSVGLLLTTSLLTLWLASGVMVSWMEGFRRCYELPKIWGLVKERMIAFSLVILAGIPLAFSTILVAFGSEIETTVLLNINHEIGYYVLLMWKIVRWLIAILTSVAVIALDLPQRGAAHPALAQRAARRDPGHCPVVYRDHDLRLVFAELCRLQRDLRVAGRRHCAAGVDVHDLAGYSDWRGIQCHAVPEVDAGKRTDGGGNRDLTS